MERFSFFLLGTAAKYWSKMFELVFPVPQLSFQTLFHVWIWTSLVLSSKKRDYFAGVLAKFIFSRKISSKKTEVKTQPRVDWNRFISLQKQGSQSCWQDCQQSWSTASEGLVESNWNWNFRKQATFRMLKYCWTKIKIFQRKFEAKFGILRKAVHEA